MNDIMMNSYNGTMRRWNGRKGLGQFFLNSYLIILIVGLGGKPWVGNHGGNT